MDKYIVYKRKSSDSEDKQVLSLDSQDRALNESIPSYTSLNIIDNHEESKSAKAPGRPKFNAMCERLEQGEANYIICWQLNRLARNPVDGGRIIWLVQNYGIKIITPSKTYDSNDILLMYVEFAMSNQFINDLRKSTTRGLDDKLRAGIAPILAPVGYYNDVTKKQGLRDILEDIERFPLVRKMWDLLLTGNYSVEKIMDIANNQWGFKQRTGNPLSRTKTYEIFNSIFYTGKYYEYRGKIYDNGIHKPMISIDEYEKAQRLLGNRGKIGLTKRIFSFTGFIKCTCGSGITAHERYRKICPKCHLKYNAQSNNVCPKCQCPAPEKTSYFCYYHCTKKVDKNCKQPYTTLKSLNEQIDNILSLLYVPQEFVDWALEELQKSNVVELDNRNVIEDNIQNKLKQVNIELDNLLKMYISVENKNKTLLSTNSYISKKDELSKEKGKIEELISGCSKKQQDWMETAEKAFDFVLYARKRFEIGTKEVKREIASAFGLNLTLENRLLRYDLKNEFAYIKKASDMLKDPLNKIEPVKKIVAEGQTYYFDSANPVWGDRRDLNPQHSPPQGDALPLSYDHQNIIILSQKSIFELK